MDRRRQSTAARDGSLIEDLLLVVAGRRTGANLDIEASLNAWRRAYGGLDRGAPGAGAGESACGEPAALALAGRDGGCMERN